MDKYIVKYLRDNATDEASKKCIDFLKIEFDRQIYKFHYNAASVNRKKTKLDRVRDKFTTIKNYLEIISEKNIVLPGKKNVLSLIEFPIAKNLVDMGFHPISPSWNPVEGTSVLGDLKTISWFRNINRTVRSGNLQRFLDPDFHREFLSIQGHLMEQYKKYKIQALFIRSDVYYMSKFALDVFRQMDLPTFVFTHGLPAIYSLEVDNRSDYLMVWGEKMKQNYINTGFDADKIKVVGHPSYQQLPSSQKLRSDFSNVLVIPVSATLGHQNEYEKTVLMDKSATVLYLYKVQKVLEKLGVSSARFRVHPSINRNWIYSFLDQNFYEIDKATLADSLKNTSLVIGATSTVLLEALIHGVNYIVYEPKQENGLNMINLPLVPPFDGSEEKLRVANDTVTLEGMLRGNALTDYTIVHDYIQDFDLSVLKEILD